MTGDDRRGWAVLGRKSPRTSQVIKMNRNVSSSIPSFGIGLATASSTVHRRSNAIPLLGECNFIILITFQLYSPMMAGHLLSTSVSCCNNDEWSSKNGWSLAFFNWNLAGPATQPIRLAFAWSVHCSSIAFASMYNLTSSHIINKIRPFPRGNWLAPRSRTLQCSDKSSSKSPWRNWMAWKLTNTQPLPIINLNFMPKYNNHFWKRGSLLCWHSKWIYDWHWTSGAHTAMLFRRVWVNVCTISYIIHAHDMWIIAGNCNAVRFFPLASFRSRTVEGIFFSSIIY